MNAASYTIPAFHRTAFSTPAYQGFIQIDRQTDYLLPPSLDEWLPRDHLARFVVEVIDGQDLTKLTSQYAGRGAAAHQMGTRPLVVEPVFGIIKSVMGFRQFSMRGLDKVIGEWTLVCLAWSVKRIAVMRLKTH